MDKNRCIGKTAGYQGLPWHLPKDFQHFKEKSLGKPIIIGRTTFEAFGAKPLPKRDNIIVTRDTSYAKEGILVAHSMEEALASAKDLATDDIIIAGGTQIYTQALNMGIVTRMILTEIDMEAEGDAYFPAFNKSEWVEISREPQVEKGIAYDFVVYERTSK